MNSDQIKVRCCASLGLRFLLLTVMISFSLTFLKFAQGQNDIFIRLTTESVEHRKRRLDIDIALTYNHANEFPDKSILHLEKLYDQSAEMQYQYGMAKSMLNCAKI